ncbi:MAG TPA: MCP four helix bundle domain-containing protein [Methanospirillum sp.]|nr:MCP four helix bundle domain-containing protein [Methanospirillum sp.]
MSIIDNIKIGKKLIGSFLIIAAIVGIVAILGYTDMKTINDGMSSMYKDRLIPIQDIGQADSKLFEIRGDFYKYILIPQEQDTLKKKFDDDVKIINTLLDSYRKTLLLDSEKTELAKFDTSWTTYQKLVRENRDLWDQGKKEEVLASLTDGPLSQSRKEVGKNMDTLVTINQKEAERLKAQADTIFDTSSFTMMLAGVIGVIAALFLGIVISRGIAIPLNQAGQMLQEMGKGHLGMRLAMNRKDEIGMMAGTMDSFADDLQQKVIGVMKQIAAGENVQEVSRGDDRDEISPALNQMIQTLNALLEQISILITEAQEGRLQTRADTGKFIGSYRDLVFGINNMLDAITIPLNETLRVAERYAAVDFDARFDHNLTVKGDLLELKIKINQIGEHVGTELKTVIQEISDQVVALTTSAESAAATVEEVASGAALIAENVANVQTNADTTRQSVEQVLIAMEELTTSVSTVASKVDSVSRLSQEADSTSTQGVQKAAVAEEGINAINGAVSDVGTIITEIRGQMNEIGKIVEIISSIADQTNLLALNAAIEAARAGDAGMGFAVVANEVKTLAQDSQGSAENIAKIITTLQRQSEKAAAAMNQATLEVSKGSVAITETITYFRSIADQTGEISMHMTEVASLTEEEAAAVEEITASVSEVKTISDATAKEALGASAASEEAAVALKQISEMQVILAQAAVKIKDSMTRLTG